MARAAVERPDLAADSGLTLLTYTAEPGSRDAHALRLLGSWATTISASADTIQARDQA